MKKRIGVVLSGCGVMDGSEIHEAVMTLYFLDKAGAEIVCMAPDKDQADVVDHLKNGPVPEKRNVLRESARIARGRIRDVKTVRAEELDAAILPGGYGAAKNLSTFAKDGRACRVDPEVARLLRELNVQGKPIGALCIAPAVIAKLLGDKKVRLTIGDDAGTAKTLEEMGAVHEKAPVNKIVVDEANRVVTTPCYMLARGIAEAGEGARLAVEKVLEMCREAVIPNPKPKARG